MSMRRVRGLPKPGLLGTFAIVSLIPIVLLGLVLTHFLKSQIHERALANARKSAELVSRLGIQPRLLPEDLRQGLTPERLGGSSETREPHGFRASWSGSANRYPTLAMPKGYEG